MAVLTVYCVSNPTAAQVHYLPKAHALPHALRSRRVHTTSDRRVSALSHTADTTRPCRPGLTQAMKKQKLTKSEMARRMDTSRPQLDRLLDPHNEGVTLDTLTKAAAAIGRKVRLELV